MKRKTAISLLILFSFLLLLSCRKAEEKGEKKKIKIGISLYDSYDTFLTGYMKAFDKEVAERRSEGYELSVSRYDAEGSQAMQNEQVEEMLQNSCDVLCVNLVDRTAPSEIIDMAQKKNVPVIFFNRELVEEDLSRWNRLYYVGADAKQSGIMQGELIAEDFLSEGQEASALSPLVDKNEDGRIQYIIFEGEAGHQDSIMRTEYVINTLMKKKISLERLSYGIANWNRAEAQSKMMQFYSEFQDKIELIISNNDDMALGALDAYRESAVTPPPVFGIDGTNPGLTAVREGSLTGTVRNDSEGQAKAMLSLALSLSTGGKCEYPLTEGRYIRLPYEPITAASLSSMTERSGAVSR